MKRLTRREAQCAVFLMALRDHGNINRAETSQRGLRPQPNLFVLVLPVVLVLESPAEDDDEDEGRGREEITAAPQETNHK